MKNLELYEKDPRENRLLNQGVVKVTSDHSENELQTLRFELSNFVCDGQYADGLERILNTYLANLDKPEQPAVWVSGFYGSGKSHLVKMLQHLWTDFEFPDGSKSRGLPKTLPKNIQDLLKEISTCSRRAGGLHAAAGTLGAGAGDSVRLEMLGVIFKSVGLPENYASASFVLWLRHEGIEEAVKAEIEKAKRKFDLELANLYVSDVMAKAILAVRPDFAAKPADVKVLLERQFPDKPEVSIDEMIAKIKQALSVNGKLPLTLIVLDEVQQYIGESVDRSKAVQDLQEQCSARLGSNVMFVGTGQNALSGTPLLQRLQGRFPVAVELQDSDVEQVTREVVLKKKPTVVAELKKMLDSQSGEIERQLASSKIAFNSKDRPLLVQDYPILPVRRRFWERVLRAVDKAGTGAQLRTQLWIVYDAVQKTAEQPVGNVVSSAFLFEHIKTKVLQSGVLLQEISETIAKQKSEDDGQLRYELCALIFLIGQLPNNGPADPGIRADAETLADLLVTDLNSSSAEIRKRIPELLEKLVAAGAVMKVDEEYRMQTREGSEWNQSFHELRNKLMNDAGKLGSERSQLLKSQCGEIMKKTKLLHGISKEPRRFDLHFGSEPPATGGNSIPVWIRDGWEVEEKTVLSEARAAGDNAALVYGFVPRKQAEELKHAIASYYAATTTIQNKGTPTTPEGIEAKKAMETRQEQAARTRDNLINDILNDAQIYTAGGDLFQGIILDVKVQEAAKACLDRLFPDFSKADSADWHKVIERAKKGDGDALSAVGYKGDPETHAVAKAIIDFVGSGKKGTDIRKQFAGPTWGWPQDAIDATLIVLFNAGLLQAKSGNESVAKGKLDQKNIPVTEFRVEYVTLSKVQLIAIRGLFKAIGLNTQPNHESSHAPEFIARMLRLAEEAGGEAPAPAKPDTSHLSDIQNRVGNEQLKAIFDNKDQLNQQIEDWRLRQEGIAKRMPLWRDLCELFRHAETLPIGNQLQKEIEAIVANRALLEDPDSVPGFISQISNELRDAINKVHKACVERHELGMQQLDQSEIWMRLTPEQKYQILTQNGIRVMPQVAVGTTAEILHTLRQTKLSELDSILNAMPTRFSNALQAAAKLLEPKAQQIHLPNATIRNDDDLAGWLKEVETKIRTKLAEGPVIV
ncbi:MAG TPA: BREX system P-loop protein BrxC [Pirellulaceae bacterium]|nr:BREX system P-loop protein BrxC [Pirellulaceae bacterium]